MAWTRLRNYWCRIFRWMNLVYNCLNNRLVILPIYRVYTALQMLWPNEKVSGETLSKFRCLQYRLSYNFDRGCSKMKKVDLSPFPIVLYCSHKHTLSSIEMVFLNILFWFQVNTYMRPKDSGTCKWDDSAANGRQYIDPHDIITVWFVVFSNTKYVDT